jgi:predicted transcriptional regulator
LGRDFGYFGRDYKLSKVISLFCTIIKIMGLKLKENLRNILKERNDLSVSSLARLAGVSKSNIQGWLDGSSPNLVQLDRVAKILNVDIEYLAFGRKEEVEECLESVLNKVLIHTGLYEVTVKKVSKTNHEK